ncbi:MAG TPA: multidrug effflux MFS transporter [Rudaea sp.]|nr:multidrug effflux MFS transporter [Rudaea sp.]
MTAIAIPRRPALAALLAALAMFGPFCIDAIFPAFPAIAARFAATPLAMQQTISVYLAAYAMMSLLLGALSDAYGRRTVILAGVGMFLAASTGCALAESMPVLLAFRALQGACAGVGLIVGRAIVRDCFEGAAAQKLMSQISMIFGVAPALAPIVGAWIVAWGGWHALFWAIAAFAGLLLALCLVVLPETHPRERRVALSPRSLFATYREIVVHPHFLPLAFAATFNFAGLFLYIAAAPAFVLGVLHLRQDQFYWLFVPTITGLVLGAMLSGRCAGRVSVRVMLGVGYSIIVGSMLIGILIAWFVVPARVPWAVLPLGLAGLGINLIAPTLNLLVLDLFPLHRGGASSVQGFMTLAFNAALAGVLASWLADDALHLAIGSAALTVCGLGAWRWYRAVAKRGPPAGSLEREIIEVDL